MTVSIKDIITEKNVIILSPHYDDVLLTFGGYLDNLVRSDLLKTKILHIVHMFSRSNYQARDDAGNMDFSLDRIKYATGIRLLEDLDCLDELLGFGNYTYQLKAERECVLRHTSWKPGEAFEFPQGTKEDFRDEEWQIYDRVRRYARELLAAADTALLIPLCIKEHIDHVIVRDAVMEAYNEPGARRNAAVYIGEDQPYAGLADRKDWEKATSFLDTVQTEVIDYDIDVLRKSELLFRHYTSQVEESYRSGVLNRAEQLKSENNSDSAMERIYRIL
jgi:hypothetical protein